MKPDAPSRVRRVMQDGGVAMSEVELKLVISPEGAEALAGSEVLSAAPVRRMQHAIYFDTPGRALAAQGISLRIREAEGKRIQTTKQAPHGNAALFERGEWEKLVDGDQPVLDDITPVRAILKEDGGDLVRMFDVDIDRRVWTLHHDGADIEVALDGGEVRIGPRHAPVHECELELKSGPAAALFSLARQIAQTAPVRIGVLSKSDRGHMLLDPAPESHKADPIHLDPESTAADAFRRIAASCLRQFRLNEDLLLATRGAEPLHQARVALRRLRSAFSIFRPMLGDEGRPLANELRWLASELGPARDLDVILHRASGGTLEDSLRRAREDAHDRAAKALGSERAARLMIDLTEWLAVGAWLRDDAHAAARAMSAGEFAAAALARFRRKVRKDGRNIAKIEDDARHEVRKDAKKLRYAVDFFETLFHRHKSRKRFVASLKDLQEQLGTLNDMATAPRLLAELGVADDPHASDLLGHARRKPLLRAAAGAYDDLVEAKRFWS
ncbi:CHAD domain-containing protein [Cereibacter sp. SYSU M97828]|nr:CHAD domain-containing protein [Cereibacter flavus]